MFFICDSCICCFAPLLFGATLSSLFSQEMLCPTCKHAVGLMNIKYPCCKNCGKIQMNIKACEMCKFWQSTGYLPRNKRIFHYTEFGQQLLYRIKACYDPELLKILLSDFSSFITKNYALSTTLFIPAPIDNRTLQKRKFNVPEIIFTYLKNKDISWMSVFEYTEKKVKKQKEKTRQERLHSQNKLFGLNRLARDVQYFQNIVVVDDIYTTGTTIYRMIRSIKPILKSYQNIQSLTLF